MKRWTTIAVLTVLMMAASFLTGWLLTRDRKPAAPAPDSTPPTAEAAAPAGPYDHLAADLASDNPELRARGQQVLAQMTQQNKPALQELIGKTTEPAALLAMHARLARIDTAALIEPPPISVSLKDATLADVAHALSKAVGRPIQVATWSGETGPFTLEARQQPFWSIMGQLSRQHAIAPTPGTYNMLLHAGVPTSRLGEANASAREPSFLNDCGFTCFSMGIRKQLTQGAAAQANTLIFDFALAADPRIIVSELTWADQSLTVENTKLTLSRQAPAEVLTLSHGVWEPYIMARVPTALRGRKATLHATARMSITLTEDVKEITAPETHVGEKITVGSQTFTLTAFTATEKRINCSISRPTQNLPCSLTIIDANGPVSLRQLQTAASTGAITGDFTLPVKLRFAVPAKTTPVTIPVDLEYDVPAG